MLAWCRWNFLCHKTGKGLLKHWISTDFISYLCAVLQCDLKLTDGLVDPSSGLGLNETRAAIKYDNKQKAKMGQQQEGQGLGKECVDWLFQLAALSLHSSSSATGVSPCKHAVHTEHLGWAAQRAWLSFAEGVAAPVCLCPATHRDMAAAHFPLLVPWWAWGPPSCVLPCPP